MIQLPSEQEHTPARMVSDSELWDIIFRRGAAKRRKGKRCSVWVKKWLLRRKERGSHGLLRKITPIIEKEDTILRDSITPGERLESTSLFSNSGCSFTSLQYSTRISKFA